MVFHLPQGCNILPEGGLTVSRFTLGLTPTNRPTVKEKFLAVVRNFCLGQIRKVPRRPLPASAESQVSLT